MKTTSEIVTSAFRKLGQLGETELLTVYQLTTGASNLIDMCDAFIAFGMPDWNMDLITIPFSTFNISGYIDMGNGQNLNPNKNVVKILGAYRRDTTSNVPLEIYTREQYLSSPALTTPSTPFALYAQPLINTSQRVYIYPTPDTYWKANGTLLIDYQSQPIETYVFSEVPSFPNYWTEALIYNLAVRLAPEYGLPKLERDALDMHAKESLALALSFTNEEGSIFITPRKR